MEVAPQHSDKITADPQDGNLEVVPTMAWQTDPYMNGNTAPEKQICGFSMPVFWLSIALVLVIIVAAVGGATGGTLAVKDAREQGQRLAIQTIQSNPTSVSTITRTITQKTSSTESSTSSSFPTPDTGCPSRDNTVFDGPSNNYRIFCDRDMAFHDLNDVIPTDPPASGLILSSVDECMTACDQWNNSTQIQLGKCVAVVFYVGNSTNTWTPWSAGYCFLKNGTGAMYQNTRTVLAIAS